MSKVNKWKYNDFFGYHLRREKLINMLLSEIIFLKTQIYKYKLNERQNYLESALQKLEFLLNILKNDDNEISDNDFEKMILLIYQIFKNIVDNLE